MTPEVPPCLARETAGVSLVSVTLAGRTGRGPGSAAPTAGGTRTPSRVGRPVGTGRGAGGAPVRAGGTGAGAGRAAEVMPKAVSRPSRPLFQPWPTARNFHSPCRR